MWLIACLFIVPICAAPTTQNVEADPNSRLMNNILSYVAEDSSACGTYFQYACGKYAVRHRDDPFTEIIQMLDHKVNGNLVQLMHELHQRSQSPGFNESSVEAKVLRFYRTCREAPPSTRKMEHYLRLAPPGQALTWPQFMPRGEPWPSYDSSCSLSVKAKCKDSLLNLLNICTNICIFVYTSIMGFFKNYTKLYQSFVTTQSNFSKITKDSNPHLNSIKSR